MSTLISTQNPTSKLLTSAEPPQATSGVADPNAPATGQEAIVFEDDFDTYEKAKLKIDRLISDFTPEVSSAKINRDHRFKDIDIDTLKKNKTIPQDGFLIPMRVIDSNIRREQPSFVNYLKNSRRLVIFKSITDPYFVSTAIEDEFTRVMSYSGWDVPHFKVVDGSQTHGFDSVEVLYDSTKPGHTAVEHIGKDRLLFPRDTISLQSCAIIARHYSVTAKQLQNFVRQFNFNAEQVKILIATADTKDKGACIEVYKCMWKKDGSVYVGWYSNKCGDWLKLPELLYLGIVEEQETPPALDPLSGQMVQSPPQLTLVPIDFYPIYILPYYETEQTRIIDHHGRVFLDKHKQEASTANVSQFLNGSQRASRPIPSAKTEVRKPSELQSIELSPDKINSIPIDWNAPPYPDASMLQFQQYLDTYNSQEAGQINYAAQNRKDSRKTATEISAAREESNLLSSVQVSLYSNFIREVYTLAWRMVQSEALQGKITFLVDTTTGTNNIEAINQSFDIRAAGDVDVIKRGELIQQYKEFWPIIQTTPAAVPFLSRLVRLVFSDEGEMYSKIIEGGDPRAVLTQLVQILNDPQITQCILAAAASVPPEQKMILMQVIEQAKGIAEQYLTEQVQKNPQLEGKIQANVGGGQQQEGEDNEKGESKSEVG